MRKLQLALSHYLWTVHEIQKTTTLKDVYGLSDYLWEKFII